MNIEIHEFDAVIYPRKVWIEDYKGEIAGVEYNLKDKRHGKVQED